MLKILKASTVVGFLAFSELAFPLADVSLTNLVIKYLQEKKSKLKEHWEPNNSTLSCVYSPLLQPEKYPEKLVGLYFFHLTALVPGIYYPPRQSLVPYHG